MKALKIITIILLAFAVSYVIARANDDDSRIELCQSNINATGITPINRLKDFTKENANNCTEALHDLVLNKQDSFYYDKYNGHSIQTWLSLAIRNNLNVGRKINPWLAYLAIANPKMKYITENDEKNYVLLSGEFAQKNSIWFIQEKKNGSTASESLTQWNLVNLADKDFDTTFARLLTNSINYENSQIDDVIAWGIQEKKFDSLTIRAVIQGDCLDSLNIHPPQNRLGVIPLKNTFKLIGDKPESISNIERTGKIQGDKKLWYLIEADKNWYVWNGDENKAYKINGRYDDADILKNNEFAAWYRLVNYKAQLVHTNPYDNSSPEVYANADGADIYCIKSKNNNLFIYHPLFQCNASNETLKDDAVMISALVKKNYLGDSLFKNVIERWIRTDEEHYVISHNYNIIQRKVIYDSVMIDTNIRKQYDLITVSHKIDDKTKWCFYGWKNRNENPSKPLQCNICPFLMNFGAQSEEGRNTFVSDTRILGVKKITDSVWRICTISLWQAGYKLEVTKIDTTSKINPPSVNPLLDLYGADQNQSEARNKYLEQIWNKVKTKDPFKLPPEGRCDDEWALDDGTLDNFFRQKIILSLLRGETIPKIRQVLPVCNFNADNSPEELLLHGKGKTATLVVPECFYYNNTALVKWKYLTEETNLTFKEYSSDNITGDSTWYGNQNISRLKSAWLAWLALGNNKVKIVSTIESCNNNISINDTAIRICFILKNGSSLFSWIGNSTNVYIPAQNEIIPVASNFFLRDESVTQYLSVLFATPVLKSEAKFYCEKADFADFKIADFFPDNNLGRTVLYYQNNSSGNKLICLSDNGNINERNIFFTYVLSSDQKNIWNDVKKIYKLNNFRLIFGKETALYAESKNPITTYWGSTKKFGVERMRGQDEMAMVFDSIDVINKYRFHDFLPESSIRRLVYNEHYYVTFSGNNIGNFEDYFYSWVNDKYEKGKTSSYVWRANPLGYFDRLNLSFITKQLQQNSGKTTSAIKSVTQKNLKLVIK